MPLVAFILDMLLMTGAFAPAIIVVACLLWFFGLRDPFLLTVAALTIGGAIGWALTVVIEKLGSGRKPDASSTPAAPPPRSQSDT